MLNLIYLILNRLSKNVCLQISKYVFFLEYNFVRLHQTSKKGDQMIHCKNCIVFHVLLILFLLLEYKFQFPVNPELFPPLYFYLLLGLFYIWIFLKLILVLSLVQLVLDLDSLLLLAKTYIFPNSRDIHINILVPRSLLPYFFYSRTCISQELLYFNCPSRFCAFKKSLASCASGCVSINLLILLNSSPANSFISSIGFVTQLNVNFDSSSSAEIGVS